MTSKRLLLYATDAYKLSSLFLRHVLLTKPPPPAGTSTTATAATRAAYYGDKTRQLLLDLSRPSLSSSSPSSTLPSSSSSSSSSTHNDGNIVAIKLLELHRELNLMQYHGMLNYIRQWWSSTTMFQSSLQKSNASESTSTDNSNTDDNGRQTKSNNKTLSNNSTVEIKSKKNVARVAFMITSDMRYKLNTNLGYTTQDIRSLTPHEAMLLLEHGVRKEHVDGEDNSFRDRLKELMKKEEEYESMIVNVEQQADAKNTECAINDGASTGTNAHSDATTTAINIRQSLTPEEAHEIHVKPDVAMALLSANNTDADTMREEGEVVHSREVVGGASSVEPGLVAMSEPMKIISTEQQQEEKHMILSAVVLDNNPPSTTVIDVTSRESEVLGMKPDVAAAILTSRRQHNHQYDDAEATRSGVGGDGPFCWYEVIERLPVKDSASNRDSMILNEHDRKEQVIALFPTEKEALECARMKQSILGLRSKQQCEERLDDDERYLVRRRLQ